MPAAAPVAPTHPFAHNPVYKGIQDALETLGKHIEAGVHPLAKQPGPDYATLAAAPTAEERSQAANDAELATAHKNKLEEIEAQERTSQSRAIGAESRVGR